MIYSIAITTDASTTEANAKKTTIKLTAGIITKVGILIPAGHAGLTFCRIHRALHQIFPSIAGQYFTGDGVYISWDDYLPILYPPFDVDIYTWNTDDTYNHTMHFHFILRTDLIGMGIGLYVPVTEGVGVLGVPSIPTPPEVPEVPEVPEKPELPEVPPPEEPLPPPEEPPVEPPIEPPPPPPEVLPPEIPEMEPHTVSILKGFGFTEAELKDLEPMKVCYLSAKYFNRVVTSVSIDLNYYDPDKVVMTPHIWHIFKGTILTVPSVFYVYEFLWEEMKRQIEEFNKILPTTQKELIDEDISPSIMVRRGPRI